MLTLIFLPNLGMGASPPGETIPTVPGLEYEPAWRRLGYAPPSRTLQYEPDVRRLHYQVDRQ